MTLEEIIEALKAMKPHDYADKSSEGGEDAVPDAGGSDASGEAEGEAVPTEREEAADVVEAFGDAEASKEIALEPRREFLTDAVSEAAAEVVQGESPLINAPAGLASEALGELNIRLNEQDMKIKALSERLAVAEKILSEAMSVAASNEVQEHDAEIEDFDAVMSQAYLRRQ